MHNILLTDILLDGDRANESIERDKRPGEVLPQLCSEEMNSIAASDEYKTLYNVVQELVVQIQKTSKDQDENDDCGIQHCMGFLMEFLSRKLR